MPAPIAIASPEAIWRLAPDAALRLRYWDGECVLYHGASGDTHRVPKAVGQLVERLDVAASTAPELSEAIDLHLDDVRRSLIELDRLGIVETTP